ncbi:Uncharacterised protein [Chryseobacterium carnipullorum]|uniref:Uncharacterized protein n=1 Tax=Chryseobacterium carnipullorum TaxID=1124835 RepID=A0A376EM23_CHRCU|nr:Uncharacterised protein [Chryseobacterium carnipullorum]
MELSSRNFSNKVYSALENTAKNIEEIEADKYLNQNYKNLRSSILANKDQPSLTTIQQVEDSGTQRQIIYSKNIISKTQLPISPKGDSIKLTTLYTDNAAYKVKKDTTNRELLTTEINNDIENGDYAVKEFVKVLSTNLPIAKRVDANILDSVIARELKIKGITAKFGYGVIDKNNKLTGVVNKAYKEKKDNNTYSYPLFTDVKNRTLYSLALVFPKKRIFACYEQLANAFRNLPLIIDYSWNLYYFH